MILSKIVFHREMNEAEFKNKKRHELLHEAEVILTTCFDSVCEDLSDIDSFDAIIVGEACQVRNY